MRKLKLWIIGIDRFIILLETIDQLIAIYDSVAEISLCLLDCVLVAQVESFGQLELLLLEG